MGKSSREEASQNNQAESGFLSHLIELRDRLLRIVIAITIAFAVLFPFANKLYAFLAGPLMKHMPEGSSMIAIDVASPFLTPFKLVLMLSVVLTIPFILYQIWSFVAPGLYKHEKRLAKPLLISSIALFYLGMAFAYYVVFPLIFAFFTSVAPEGVAVSTDINRYLDFVLMLFLAFGIAFEVPVATILVLATGVTTTEKLAKMRPYIIVAAFVIGMLLTPPDVVSQILLAIPIWMLFEAGLWTSKLLLKPSDEAEEAAPSTTPAAAGVAPTTSSMESAINDAIAGEPPYRALTDEEMEAELDQIEEEETRNDSESPQEEDNSGRDEDPKPKG
ncbi:MAG: twin-arginine translocase subunit TatC [Thiotrichales bacterium]